MPLDDVNPESWRRLLAATSEYCSSPSVAAQFDELTALLIDSSSGSCSGSGAIAGEGAQQSPPPFAPRADMARGVLLVEAPPSTLSSAAGYVDASAAAVARLPYLRRRYKLVTAAATAEEAVPKPLAALAEELVGGGHASRGSCGGSSGGGSGYGVVHLALHGASQGELIGGWRTSVRAVLEPSPEAARLAAEISAASHSSSPTDQLTGVGHSAPGSLAAVLHGGACVTLPGGELLAVLSHQRVRTQAEALVTSWLLEIMSPDAAALVRIDDLLTLAPGLNRGVLVSAAELPGTAITWLLRAGTRAVISPVSGGSAARRLQAACADTVQAFFAALYIAMAADCTVPDALTAAEGECPALAGLYRVHHL